MATQTIASQPGLVRTIAIATIVDETRPFQAGERWGHRDREGGPENCTSSK